MNHERMKLKNILFLFAAACLWTACSEEENGGDPYFTIEGNPTSLSVTKSGIDYDLTKAQKYIVRSNRPWKIVAQGDADWVRIFPMEGDADGMIRISVKENMTFDERVANFAFVVGGEEQATLFRVEQDASVPAIRITGSESGLVVARDGGSVKVPVVSNITWRYELSEGADWLTPGEITESSLAFTASKNNLGKTRTAILTLVGVEHPDVTAQITITQTGALLYEDFSWLNYGNVIHWETTGETAITKWTNDEMGHGWTSRSGWCYSRPGFIKLGKTSYGGDVVSPKLASITGSRDVVVSFKATAYISKGGAKDDNTLYVGVLGDGTLEGGVTVNYAGADLKFVSFTIDNYPNSSNMENGTDYDVWAPALAERTITVKGATANTQLVFLGGVYDSALGSVGSGKNRIFLDDIVVLEK